MPGSFTIPPETWLRDPVFQDAVAVHLRQGVPLLDRDLNLLGDLPAEQARDAISSYLGDGTLVTPSDLAVVERDDQLPDYINLLEPSSIDPTPGGPGQLADFTITPGRYAVGGIVVSIAANIEYSKLPGAIDLSVLSATGATPRTHAIYLDIATEEIDAPAEADVGEATSVRSRAHWTIGIAPDTPLAKLPAPAPGHTFVPLAEITLSTTADPDVEDPYLGRPLPALAILERWVAVFERALRPVLSTTTLEVASGQVGGTDGGVVGLSAANLDRGAPEWMFDGQPLLRAGADFLDADGKLRFQEGFAGPSAHLTVVSNGMSAVQVAAPRAPGSVTLAAETEFGRAEVEIFVSPLPAAGAEWFVLPDVKGLDIGAMGDDVWLVSQKTVPGGREILRWTGQRFEPVPGGSIDAERIAVGLHGTAWVVTSRSTLLRYRDGAWTPVPGAATDICTGSDGSVYKIGTRQVAGGRDIARFNDGRWETIDGGGERIAVGHQGDIFVVDSQGRALRRRFDRWMLLSSFDSFLLRAYDVASGTGGLALFSGDVRGTALDDATARGVLTFDGRTLHGTASPDFKPHHIAVTAWGQPFSVTPTGEVIRFARKG